MSKTVSIDGMAEAINEGLQEYAKLASFEVKRAVRKSAKTVKEQIETGAPSRTGRYKSSWVATKQEESSQSLQMVVHSKDRYQLAHLLENGHAKRVWRQDRTLLLPSRRVSSCSKASSRKH